ncbi:alpha/beta hydrolase family protein [Microbulbifer sp.]|uniref:alpha/beta hydrolase family protein n=1 Tax=Microbulbifer sp. TaxID=1908541 RepID=UPI003F38D7E4
MTNSILRPLKICVAFLLSFCWFLSSHAAEQAELSVREYGALPNISMMSISPSGDMIAFRNTRDESDIVVVISLKEKKRLAALDLSEITPHQLYFATEDELILVVSEVRHIFGYRDELDLSTAYAFNLHRNELRQLLTPGDVIYPGQSGLGRIVGLSPDRKYVYMPAYVPEHRHDRSPDRDLLRVELDSPRRPKVHFTGKNSSVDFFVDREGEVIAHEIFNNRRDRHRILARQGEEWKEIYRKDTEVPKISVVGISPDRESLVVLANNDSTGRDDYYLMSLLDGELHWAGFGREDADVEHTYKDLDRVVWGVRYSGFTPSYQFFDPELDRRMADIQAMFPEHSVWLRGWSEGWKDLIVYVEGSSFSGHYYKFSQGQPPVQLATARPNITDEHIHPIGKLTFRARDGLPIPTLLTIPRDKLGDMKKLPAVLMPHGGPASYDRIGFDWLAQALANRGYLVIQPQFRGSRGFGQDHYQAGHGEWGRKMQDDLTDAVQFHIDKGMVDPERVCIVGASYGGYAALAGGAFTPELYRCVVSINGVADLRDMLKQEKRDHGGDHWVLAYWENNIAKGDASKEKLNEISPARHAKNFQAPVLLIHGEKDKTVPFAQSKTMYKQLKRAKKTVEFLELEEENHNLLQGETRLQAVEAVVAFVDRHLQ